MWIGLLDGGDIAGADFYLAQGWRLDEEEPAGIFCDLGAYDAGVLQCDDLDAVGTFGREEGRKGKQNEREKKRFHLVGSLADAGADAMQNRSAEGGIMRRSDLAAFIQPDGSENEACEGVCRREGGGRQKAELIADT